jgi:hypothetical protein
VVLEKKKKKSIGVSLTEKMDEQAAAEVQECPFKKRKIETDSCDTNQVDSTTDIIEPSGDENKLDLSQEEVEVEGGNFNKDESEGNFPWHPSSKVPCIASPNFNAAPLAVFQHT